MPLAPPLDLARTKPSIKRVFVSSYRPVSLDPLASRDKTFTYLIPSNPSLLLYGFARTLKRPLTAKYISISSVDAFTNAVCGSLDGGLCRGCDTIKADGLDKSI